MHYLVVSCSVVAYLSANVYAIVKVRVFELARSRKHLLLYGVPFVELSHPIGMQAHGDHAPIRRVGCVIAHGDDFLRTELQKTQLTTESALSTPDTSGKATCSRFDDSNALIERGRSPFSKADFTICAHRAQYLLFFGVPVGLSPTRTLHPFWLTFGWPVILSELESPAYIALPIKGVRYAPPIVPGKEPLSRAQQTMCGKIRHRRHKALIDSGQNLPDNGRGGLITFKKVGPPT